ncbi:MAG: pilus assembly protein PilM [Oscillospiraceae bacterium]|nr:pilus assembly protein PilM [Oscillospiraceae bacterium]
MKTEVEKNKKSKELKSQSNVVFALDIGTRTIVGVIGEQEENSSGTGAFNMLDHIVVAHPKRAMIDGQIEDIRQVAKIVTQVKEQLEKRSGIKLERVSIAAAGRALKTRRVEKEIDVSEVERIDSDVIRSLEIEAIQTASEELMQERGVTTPYYCVGFSVINYLLDGNKMLNLDSHKGSKAGIELIATFLPNVVVEGLYSVMDMCSLSVSSLTLEPIAAMNAIIPKEIRLINIALVDIGAGTSDIAISKDGSIIAYAMATIAGDEITEEIIKAYFVDFDTAEKIKQTCCAGEDCTYKDIFGIERTFTAKEFDEKIQISVDGLADTICQNIVEANGSSPAAVFLVGGGSLVKGLQQAVANRLELPIERVALGSNEVLKNIKTGEASLGAEFITPLGIAVTGAMNKGYDFSTITLNERQIRVFNTNKITVFEILTTAGYKSNEILGRSGHNLTYIINGERRTVRGGGFEPAQVIVNGKAGTLNSQISGGDKVEFMPAVCGENATLLLKEAISPSGAPVPDEIGFTVNDKNVPLDYSVKNLDKIETFLVGEEIEVEVYEIPQEADDTKESPKTEKLENSEALEVGESTLETEISATLDSIEITESSNSSGSISKDGTVILPKALIKSIDMILNELPVTLPANADNSPHTFIELINHVDIDLDNPPSPTAGYVMTLNGRPAGFNDTLKEGDKAVLKWQN